MTLTNNKHLAASNKLVLDVRVTGPMNYIIQFSAQDALHYTCYKFQLVDVELDPHRNG